MEKNNIAIEAVNELINEWNGANIKIIKQEIKDTDEILLELNRVAYEKNTRTIDDYESKYTLQFHGTGKIRTDDQALKPLPDSLYEIPLEDNSIYQYDGSRLYLQTDRGNYTIEKDPANYH